VAKFEASLNSREITKLLSIGGPKVLKFVGQVLYKEGATIFEESQDEVPVDTNALRTSGNLGFPQLEGQSVVVEISYGGAAADYAMIVHEDLEARHRDGKKAKYLEDPARRGIEGLDRRILEKIRKAMGI
jgi:hypothetical protein